MRFILLSHEVSIMKIFILVNENYNIFVKKKNILVNNQNTNQNKFSNVSQFNKFLMCSHLHYKYPLNLTLFAKHNI